MLSSGLVSDRLGPIRCPRFRTGVRGGSERTSERILWVSKLASGFAKNQREPYLSSSIAASNTSLPGRVTDSGSVASGWSVMLSMSRKLGACGFT
jgi:hypothetical protein